MDPMKPARHPPHRWAGLLLVGILGADIAHAQGAAARSPEVQQRIAQAKQRLQLTPQQETQLRAILQEEAQKLRAIRDKYANDSTLQGRGARSRELQTVQEDLHAKLQGVLSPAQFDEWDRMAAERRAQARERRQQQP
jgi:hypothetical protein